MADRFIQYYGLQDHILPGLANSFVETEIFNDYRKLIIANKVATVMDFFRGVDMAVSSAKSLHRSGDSFVMTVYGLKGQEYESVQNNGVIWKMMNGSEFCETYVHDVDKSVVEGQAKKYGVDVNLDAVTKAVQYVSFHSDSGV